LKGLPAGTIANKEAAEKRPSSNGQQGVGPPPKVAAFSERELPSSQHQKKPRRLSAATLFSNVANGTQVNKEAAQKRPRFSWVASLEARAPKRPVTLVAVGPPPNFFDTLWEARNIR
jgi:hypothetical protein